jgi:hypothetical protein
MEKSMELTRISGIVIIIGFIIFWVGNLSSPPGVYQERDLDLRLQAIETYPSRWAISQGLGGVGIGIIAIGLLILSLQMAGDYGPWLTYLPAILNIIAALLAAVYLYQYITDPASIWGASGRSMLILTTGLLMMAAGLLYGILFIQMGLPKWLDYLTVGYTALALIAIPIANPPTFYVISLYYFILLAAGIVLIWQ